MAQKIFSSKSLLLFNLASRKVKRWVLHRLSKVAWKPLEYTRALNSIQKMLVILPDTLQEVLLLQRDLMSLKIHFKQNFRLEVVCEQSFKEIIEGNAFVDQGIFYAKKEFTLFTPSFKDLCKHLRKQRFDAVLLFDRRWSYVKQFLMGVTKAPLRIGLAGKTEVPFVNLSIRPSQHSFHVVNQFDCLLECIGIKVAKTSAKWKTADSSVRDVTHFLEEHQIDRRKKVIGLLLGEDINRNKFPNSFINALVPELAKSLKLPLVGFVDGLKNGEGTLSKEIQGKVIPYLPRSISESAAMLERCEFIITPHHPVYHLSNYLGKKCIGIFEGGEPEKWASNRSKNCRNIVIKKFKMLDSKKIVDLLRQWTPSAKESHPTA